MWVYIDKQMSLNSRLIWSMLFFYKKKKTMIENAKGVQQNSGHHANIYHA